MCLPNRRGWTVSLFLSFSIRSHNYFAFAFQRVIFAGTGLQAELQAAQKESEYVRQKLKQLEGELNDFRTKNDNLNEELEKKTGTEYIFCLREILLNGMIIQFSP